MTGTLLCDVWPVLAHWPKPKEKEEKKFDPANRNFFYRDRKKKKKKKAEKEELIKVPYGKKGDTVTIVSQHENVYIVEGKKERFPVNETNISINS